MYFSPVNHAALRQNRGVNHLLCVVGSLESMQLAPPSERPVKVESGANEAQMREGLREVSQRLAAGPDLLGVESQVIGIAEHLLEDEPGLFQPPRA